MTGGLRDPSGGWRDVLTFDEASEYQHGQVTCRSHHTYVDTDVDHAAGVWRCPQCGNVSDRAEQYTGGWGLVTPSDGFLEDGEQ